MVDSKLEMRADLVADGLSIPFMRDFRGDQVAVVEQEYLDSMGVAQCVVNEAFEDWHSDNDEYCDSGMVAVVHPELGEGFLVTADLE